MLIVCVWLDAEQQLCNAAVSCVEGNARCDVRHMLLALLRVSLTRMPHIAAAAAGGLEAELWQMAATAARLCQSSNSESCQEHWWL
jgi:hypothetical protein